MADKKKDEASTSVTIPVDPNLDPATRDDLIRQLAGGTNPALGIVGNLADVQRAGAAIVTGEKGANFASGVVMPPGVTDEDIAAAKAVNDAVASAS